MKSNQSPVAPLACVKFGVCACCAEAFMVNVYADGTYTTACAHIAGCAASGTLYAMATITGDTEAGLGLHYLRAVWPNIDWTMKQYVTLDATGDFDTALLR